MGGWRCVVPALLLASSAAAGAAWAEDAPVVFREEGKASYYGNELTGRKTASGERYDPKRATAAHRTLPLGSEVTVTNPENGKKVDVVINDRGPHVASRAIDLSQGAAKKIGLDKAGVAPVEIEATKPQVEQAIDDPDDVTKVERQLKKARAAAAEDGTRQPRVALELEAPDSARN